MPPLVVVKGPVAVGIGLVTPQFELPHVLELVPVVDARFGPSTCQIWTPVPFSYQPLGL